ncbi:hypothetical protein OUZ56_019008 [Daphnia magna]|uniref:Uncharacterized protein n=1 Tax=Daphnia magna TaxID=35525 RepID=A0ABQ9ZAD7_9CRUS|nr:hypothetical protein OUZ56_019008 [Daphnia magna]
MKERGARAHAGCRGEHDPLLRRSAIRKSSEFQQQQQQRASGVKYIESQDITLSASRHGISDTTKFQPKRFHPLREPNNPFRPNSHIKKDMFVMMLESRHRCESKCASRCAGIA